MKERQEKILFLITEEFIKSSIPVSSTKINDLAELDCCSATIRNEMAILERKKMIEKPHSSSGRVPTAKGYRYYLENSKQESKFEGLKVSIEEIFKNRVASIESVVDQACYLISDILKLPVAIFKSTSQNSDKKLQSIQLIKLDLNKCMLVLIANNEVLVEKILNLDEKSISDLQLSIAIISKRLFNAPLKEIKERLDALVPLLIKNINNFEGNLQKVVLEVFKRALMSVNVYGTSNMLSAPELQNPAVLQSLVSLLDNKNIWKLLSEEFLPVDNKENQTKLGFVGKEELSVVSMGMENDFTLAVVGPKRVDYAKIIAALDVIKSNLEQNRSMLAFQDKSVKKQNSNQEEKFDG